jgi:carboxylate-amine ligase
VSPDELRAPFDAAPANAVGIEDEVMLLEPESLELAHRAPEVLASVGDDPRFKLELPASQLEILTPPSATVPAAAAALLDGRRALVLVASGEVSFASAGVHPFSAGTGKLNRGPRYDPIIADFGCIAERELVCALQVHVSVGDSDRALAVYNAARSYLPYLAALAANAPLYEGVDTGLASVRPKLAELLPRQGVPPAIASWQSYAETLAWGRAAGAFPDLAKWWWELRLHPGFGTLEFRVPDGQTTVGDAAAIAAVIQALVGWLGERHDAREQLAVAPSWRIEENRWSACRDGVEGEMADLRTGRRRSTRGCLRELFDALQPIAKGLGAEVELDHARRMSEVNGAMAQRVVAREAAADGVARWLAERFLDPSRG